ncbi:hypothetical protein DRV85_16470 [Rhodosalinus halophilus]|uniref:DNA-binding protein H-NS-like C-terminal domain-containing protein n=1 Tax=Rhodosalinus halophilus TaxID=2259333 RepID=A0A365U4M8_9RHOB|nr:H-NS histone family protein [Rhodosalinus halophilus]RBI83198.1 hypothetical protein DRV85_16470 [Rhodosalinus halophilus]
MPPDELQALRRDVDRALAHIDERYRLEALAALRAEAAKRGFELDELLKAGGGLGASKSKGTPRYVHPKDPSLTWTGKGRRPNWVNEYIQRGGQLADLEIGR